MQLSDNQIIELAKNGMIDAESFREDLISYIDHNGKELTTQQAEARKSSDSLGFPDFRKVISYGTSSYGYDSRIFPEYNIFTNVNSGIIDPKNFKPDSVFVSKSEPICMIPANSFILARTVEYFKIPRDILAICLGKSTYARCGLIVNVTPLEPEWEGHVTLEISNTTPLPAVVYGNEGICQFIFLRADEACHTSYLDRGGKYQGQRGITVAR